MQELYSARKLVAAKPMSRTEFLTHINETDSIARDDAGYLVEYLDGGPSNHPEHSGYISWCPKDVFERQNVYVGGSLELPDHVCRLLAEHALLLSDNVKLTKFIELQYSLRCADLPEDILNANTKVSAEHLDLLVQQAAAQKALLDILARRLLISDLGHSVEHRKEIKYSLSTGNTFNVLHSVSEDYAGVILSIDPDIKVIDGAGNEVEHTTLVTKLSRGWAISGNIGEELFDVGVIANGPGHVTSSFASEGDDLNVADYTIVLDVELGMQNRLPSTL